ncbi:hypothetical protein HQ563_01710, partial [bacterium]|nr:hypothetical protein [bacterium]
MPKREREEMNEVEKHNRGAEGHVVLPRIILGFLVLLLFASLSKGAQDSREEEPSSSVEALERAEKLFKEQHWAEAKAAYDRARDLEADWHSPRVRLAVEGAVACSLKLQQWDDALERAAQFVEKTKGSFEEAVGERFFAGLYLSVPHYGTKRGGTYLRGQWTQGVQVSSWRKDRKDAIGHYERARDLLIGLAENLGTENNPDTPERRALITAERIG